MIPTRFTPTSMERLLERKVREGTVTKEERIVKIEPAYFSNFYGDGVPTVKLKDGSIEVNTKVYVLGPQ